MNMSFRPFETLRSGDVYLFHATNPRCPNSSSLWAMIASQQGARVLLESSTEDQRRFSMWRPLAIRYRYCRLATRSELRDYMVNLTNAEMRKIR